MSRSFQLLIFCVLLFACKSLFATHNRAGEITYVWKGANSGDFKYEVTIITYTRTSSITADRPSLDSVHWGDGTIGVFNRIEKIDYQNDISRNKYVNTHTYAGNGEFKIFFEDPNRNAGVVNIPGSVGVPFYLETTLLISPFLGQNHSPVLTYPPIDSGCIGRIYKHNPAAFDADPKDSLSYELTICGGAGGLPISGYTFPHASNSFSLNPINGDLIWDSPTATGEYNVAFNIIQWRNGFEIGKIRRDLQITILTCSNNPPNIQAVHDTCVLAGDTLSFNVTAIDPDQDKVELSAWGGPLDTSLVHPSATFTPIVVNNDTVVSNFKWITGCSNVRPQPYYVQFRAVDEPVPVDVSLVDLKGAFIRVIAPGPPSVTATPNGSSIDLHWTPSPCASTAYYNVYRREGQFTGTIDCPCTTGVPTSTGYVLIGHSDDTVNTTTFTDNNNGQGLSVGIQYCYMITAVYANGSESCASPQTCASLKRDAPVITNADVRVTDLANGSVYVAWSWPAELDTLAFPGPFQYKVYRSDGFFGGNFSGTPIAIKNFLSDTTFIDTLIDTKTNPWSYKIELFYTDTVGNDTLRFKGQTAVASTVFLKIAPTDNALNLTWTENVPWSNNRYDIFKQNASLTFDSIASVTTNSFVDTGLINGTQYCYYIRSSGTYFLPGLIDPILNRSQQVCEIPFDNVHPCSPDLTVNSDCDNNLNQLVWTNPNNTCADDVLGYYIYFGNEFGGNYELIDSTNSPTDTIYIHDHLAVLSGCYKVAAFDSVHNETLSPEAVCVDTCRQYVLPSVFTPNSDGKNDFFHPCDSTTDNDLQEKNCPAYKNVKSVEIKIFNRWGSLVFETKDKDINWDGKYKGTNKECSEGVYYYTCKVYFFSVFEQQVEELHGTVQLIR